MRKLRDDETIVPFAKALASCNVRCMSEVRGMWPNLKYFHSFQLSDTSRGIMTRGSASKGTYA